MDYKAGGNHLEVCGFAPGTDLDALLGRLLYPESAMSLWIPRKRVYTSHSLLSHQMSRMFVLGEHSLDSIHSLLQLVPRWAKGQANKVMTRRVEQVSL